MLLLLWTELLYSQGKSCFPLSPPGSKKVKVNEFGFPNEKADQLNVIFDVIGSPNEESMGFVTDPNAVLYLKSLSQKKRVKLILKLNSLEIVKNL